MTRLVIAALLFASTAAAAASPQAAARPGGPPSQVVSSVAIAGAKQLSEPDLLAAAGVRVGDPLPAPPDDIAARMTCRYQSAGYTFARVTASWDVTAGRLSLVVDEGVIGRVEIRGVAAPAAASLADDFALKPGDTFNDHQAEEALMALLRPTRGAIVPEHQAFEMTDVDGARVLIVHLREPTGRLHIAPDLGDREDWFTPVDGFVPSLGFGAAIFDHESFNHAFISGHVSFKTATDDAGYALGFEKPFFGARKLFVGAEVHDLTATDDDWRVTSFEASLSAMAVRRPLRDYYGRRGVQLNAAFRPEGHVELLAAWRDESEALLPVATDFSIWRGDETFRPNRAAAAGRLHAVVFGASIDGHGFDRDSLEDSYRRHQLESAFGGRLGPLSAFAAEWRVDWQTEVSTPGLGGDFDFTRSIVSARYRTMLSPHQELGVRGIQGWSTGFLPPQRLFALGGVGSVEGWPFEAQIGTGMTLLDLEYAVGWREGPRVFGLADVGRATSAGVDEPWMKSLGFGIGIGDSFRIDCAWGLGTGSGSPRVLFRFGRTF